LIENLPNVESAIDRQKKSYDLRKSLGNDHQLMLSEHSIYENQIISLEGRWASLNDTIIKLQGEIEEKKKAFRSLYEELIEIQQLSIESHDTKLMFFI